MEPMRVYHSASPMDRIRTAATLAFETWRDDGPRTLTRLNQLAAFYAIGWNADLEAVTEMALDLRLGVRDACHLENER